MKRRVCMTGILGMVLVLRLIAQSAESDFKTDGNGTILSYEGWSEQVVIPPQIGGKPVKAIGKEAFKSSDLTAITIPNSVTAIEGSAFAFNQLTSVTIGSNVSIGYEAFGTLSDFNEIYNNNGKKAGKYTSQKGYYGFTNWSYSPR